MLVLMMAWNVDITITLSAMSYLAWNKLRINGVMSVAPTKIDNALKPSVPNNRNV